MPEFTVSHDSFQAADNVKWLFFSREFDVPRIRPVTLAADLRVTNIGGDASDPRLGMAAFSLTDAGDAHRCG